MNGPDCRPPGHKQLARFSDLDEVGLWGFDRKRLVGLMTSQRPRYPKCFTCTFRSQYQRTRKEQSPVLSRIQNIGYELGENSRTAKCYRASHRTPWVAKARSSSRHLQLCC
jgi:hypothetical protein